MLASFTISLSIWFSGVVVTDWQLDVSPAFLVEANVVQHPVHAWAAVSLPHIIFASAPTYARGWSRSPARSDLRKHELGHVRQWEHLGPGFALAYLLMPIAFEDYLSHPDPPWAGTELNCPALRISNTSVELLPCWRFP